MKQKCPPSTCHDFDVVTTTTATTAKKKKKKALQEEEDVKECAIK